MGDSSDSGRPGYSYEEVKAILGNARLPRNPQEEVSFAIQDARKQGWQDALDAVEAKLSKNSPKGSFYPYFTISKEDWESVKMRGTI